MMSLIRISSTRVYAGSAAQGEPGYLAFLVSTLPDSPEPQLPLKQAWQDELYRGYFVILAEPPANLDEFAQALQDSKDLPAPDHTSLAWARYTAATKQIVIVKLLALAGSGPSATVVSDERFAFRNYGFPIAAQSPVTFGVCAGGTFGLHFGYPPLPDLPPSLQAGLMLPLEGKERYAFQGQGLIEDFTDTRDTGWDVAFRYYSETADGEITAWRYPIFDKGVDGLHYILDMRWDLLNPLDASLTYLAFTKWAFVIKQSAGPPAQASIEPYDWDGTLPASLRTLYGDPLRLRPRLESDAAQRPRLVFESVPDSRGNAAVYNLVPAGDFNLVHAGSGETDMLLPGLSGTEFIRFTDGTDILRFTPRMPAFAAKIPGSEAVGISSGAQTDLLGSRFTTAWVSVGASKGNLPAYSSQPRKAPLFQPGPASAPPQLLDLYTEFSAGLTLERSFPIASYSRLAAGHTADDFSAFETAVLAPARYAKLGAQAQKIGLVGDSVTKTAATPQGFVVTIEDGVWKSVVLARRAGEAGTVTQLAFHDVSPALKSALQSSELFLVITDAQAAGNFENRITIAGWPFTINLGADAQGGYSNVLIMKFGPLSLKDYARSVASWTDAATFNKDPQKVSSWIWAYIAQTELEAETVPEMAAIANLLADPAWNGVIALRVDVSTQSFPEDLKGLLGGIDLTRFYAHHLGITVNYIRNAQQIEMPADSSLFGLIYYRDANGQPSDQPQQPPAFEAAVAPLDEWNAQRATARALAEEESESFDYRVLLLLVQIANSDITQFVSRIILTISNLFGASVELAVNNSNAIVRNSIVLDGSYQNTAGKRSYSFAGQGEYRFIAASTVTKYIQVTGAAFHTVKSMGAAGPVQARFDLTGYLNFYAVPDFDAFSFGDDSNSLDLKTAGLRYANLGVGIEFPLDDPTQLAFTFDPSRMSFDTTLSAARPAGLFAKFPLTVSSIVTGAADRKIEDLGYLAVKTRSLQSPGDLSGQWYGLAYLVNLGSLGGLAQNAGLSATLLVAWSPGAAATPVNILISLPGLGTGKKELSLQSVLKLTIGGVEFSTQTDDDGNVTAYILKLANVGLSFLGQKLPPSGVTNMALFSDFRDGSGGSSLSWYAAYYSGAKSVSDTELVPLKLEA